MATADPQTAIREPNDIDSIEEAVLTQLQMYPKVYGPVNPRLFFAMKQFAQELVERTS